jgi:hypothetical protein
VLSSGVPTSVSADGTIPGDGSTSDGALCDRARVSPCDGRVTAISGPPTPLSARSSGAVPLSGGTVDTTVMPTATSGNAAGVVAVASGSGTGSAVKVAVGAGVGGGAGVLLLAVPIVFFCSCKQRKRKSKEVEVCGMVCMCVFWH